MRPDACETTITAKGNAPALSGEPDIKDSGSVLRPAIGGNVLAAASEVNCSLHERPASGAAQCIHIE